MTSKPPSFPGDLIPKVADPWAWLSLILKVTAGGVVMALGAAYGVAAYSAFVRLFPANGVMLWSFLAGVPLVIGLLVGYLARTRLKAGLSGASALALLAIALGLFAAGAFLREGTICILMALPLFIAFCLVGALVDWLTSRNNPRGPWSASFVLLAPALAGSLETRIVPADLTIVTVCELYIAAAPAVVWRHINYPTGIRPDELSGGIAYKIGVPYPIEARTIEARAGGRRELAWQRGIKFEEIITEWQPERRIAWNYKFGPDSFPPGSLDDHVVIGGQYFDLVSTSYDLQPEGSGTRLKINVQSRVTTHFNWYAGYWARYLIDDTAKTILNFYKSRSEKG